MTRADAGHRRVRPGVRQEERPMRVHALLQIGALAIATAVALCPIDAGAARAGDTVTIEYLDGRKATIQIGRLAGDYIFVKTQGGGYNIFAKDLSDKTLRDLGMTYALRQREESKRQAEFERKQKEKGLVEFRGRWVTPTQKQEIVEQEEAAARERDYIRQADKLVMAKYWKDAPFKVFQPHDEGSLCVAASEYLSTLRQYLYNGEIFFWLGATRNVTAQDEEYVQSFYWAGTWTYTTVEGKERTVNCFTTDLNLARTAIRNKFALYDKVEPDSPPRHAGGTEGGAAVADTPQPRAFGSGFIITEDGYIISNAHVVEGAARVQVRTATGLKEATIVGQDKENDLALLKIEGQHNPVQFAEARSAKLGQTIFALGFPLPELQGFEPKVTKGVVSSLRGIQDDIRRYQIDAAVQPGNSGGPLADEKGNIVGVVVARLNDAYVMRGTGSVPQNVNYAVKKAYVLALLDSYPKVSQKIKTDETSKPVQFEDAVDKVRQATVLVVTY